MPTLFRLYYLEQGAHTTVRVFAGKGTGALGKCGNLVFRNEEWSQFKGGVERTIGTKNGIGHYVEFISEVGEDPRRDGTGIS